MSTETGKVISFRPRKGSVSNATFPKGHATPAVEERLCTRDYTGHVGKIYTQIWQSGDALWAAIDVQNPTVSGLKHRVVEEAGNLEFVMQESLSGMEALYEQSKADSRVSDPRSISFTVAVERAIYFLDWMREMVANWEKESVEEVIDEVREISFEMSGDDPAWAVILKIHADSQKKPA